MVFVGIFIALPILLQLLVLCYTTCNVIHLKLVISFVHLVSYVYKHKKLIQYCGLSRREGRTTYEACMALFCLR